MRRSQTSPRWLGLLSPFVWELLEPRRLLAGGGLVAAYGFDENAGPIAGDASGTGNQGTISGAAWTASGRFGNALSFDGANDLVTVADSTSLDLTTGMTLQAWINPAAGAGVRDVIIKEGSGLDLFNLYHRNGQGAPESNVFVNGQNRTVQGSTVPLGVWTHLAGTYDGTVLRLYVNGSEAASLAIAGSIPTSSGALRIGGNGLWGEYFQGVIDEVRIYNRALSGAEIQADMNTPVGSSAPDTIAPTIAGTAPVHSATSVGANTNLTVNFSEPMDPSSISGSTIELRTPAGELVPSVVTYNPSTFTATLDPTGALPQLPAFYAAGVVGGSGGVRDVAGNPLAADHSWSFATGNLNFINETVIANGLTYPTFLEFLPDGRMLIGELQGKIWSVQPGATQVDPVPILQLTNINNDGLETGGERGMPGIALDPDFASNGYFYIFYTANSPLRDRVSRFTMQGGSASLASEVVIWQDSVNAGVDHHGGSVLFGPDGKLYISVGDHAGAGDVQSLSSYHGKILRLNPDGTAPTDNPFHDGGGPNLDVIWARGLRNPFRISFDPGTGRMYIADVGDNNVNTSIEEVNIGAAGANFGWPLAEGTTTIPGITNPIFTYPHAGRDASITGGFVYRTGGFPSEFSGSYFYGDYAQNWIRRLTLDANGNVTGSFFFEPIDGATDGAMGDPVHIRPGPDGWLYYVDFGWPGPTNPAAIKRIKYLANNQAPIVVASAAPQQGAPPLTVNFSSAGTVDPEGQSLSYLWTFGDGQTSTLASPSHEYTAAGEYIAQLRVSDGVNNSFSAQIPITVGSAPVPAVLSPTTGTTFRAGDVINFSGVGFDNEDGWLAPSAFSWQVLFHHEGHVHPVLGPLTGTTSGSFSVPTSGHDFAGNTNYEVILTVTDSDGIQRSHSATILPQKVNLTIQTSPAGSTVMVNGIARATPYVLDSLIGFEHALEAPLQVVIGGTSYSFNSWSDGGARVHTISTPGTNASYTATYVGSGQGGGPIGPAPIGRPIRPPRGLIPIRETNPGPSTVRAGGGWLFGRDSIAHAMGLVSAADPLDAALL